MSKPRFPEMDLVINGAGKEVFAFSIDLGVILTGCCDLWLYFLDPSIPDQYIGSFYLTFIDHLNIFYQVYLHNLLPD
jgi:hypothetical protein